MLNIDGPVPGVSHDVLKADGKALLGGTLQLEFSDAFTPSPGQRFTVIEAAGGIEGGFVSVTANKGVRVTTSQDATHVSVIVN